MRSLYPTGITGIRRLNMKTAEKLLAPRHANATAIVYVGVTEAARDAIAAKLLAVEFGA